MLSGRSGTLEPGSRLGAYEVLEPGGRIGDAQVYLGRDTQSNRTVTLGVIPRSPLSGSIPSGELHQRLGMLSALAHPNLARICGFERTDDYSLVVYEQTEGELLSAGLKRTEVGLSQGLTIAAEISEGLHFLHRQGMLHGALTPSRVVLTAAGVKLTAFGLGQPLEQEGETGTGRNCQATAEEAQYVAPEVLSGKQADVRSEIYSLGSILLELFSRSASTVQSIAGPESRPEFRTLPLELRRTLEACVAAAREERWQSAGDVALRLRWVQGRLASDSRGSALKSGSRARVWAGMAILAAALAGGAWLGQLQSKPVVKARWNLFLQLDPNAGVSSPGSTQLNSFFAVSPNGKMIAMNATIGGKSGVWLRSLASDELRFLDFAESQHRPFWSPDSGFVGFSTGSEIELAAIDGSGTMETIGTGMGNASGGNGGLLVADREQSGALVAFRRERGAWQRSVLRVPPDTFVFFDDPQFLSNGKDFLYRVTTGGETGDLYMGSTASDRATRLLGEIEGFDLPIDKRLLYLKNHRLYARDFDPVSGTLGDRDAEIARGVAAFSATPDVVVYEKMDASQRAHDWRWAQRAGTAGHPAMKGLVEAIPPPYSIELVKVSPNGKLIAFIRKQPDGLQDLWLYDAESHGVRALSHDGRVNSPVWSPDSTSLAYSAGRTGFTENYIYSVSLLQPTPPRMLYRSREQVYPLAWSADGKNLLYEKDILPENYRMEIWRLEIGTDREFPVVVPEGAATQARISPDNRWILYSCNDGGRSDVYVSRFEAGPVSERYLVSLDGGEQPSWSHDGRQAYYVSAAGRLLAVDFSVSRAGTPNLGRPQPVSGMSMSLIHTNVVVEDRNRYALMDGDSTIIYEQAVYARPLPHTFQVIPGWNQ
jgi:eukaryotic-like serine/threonine-protein kinase